MATDEPSETHHDDSGNLPPSFADVPPLTGQVPYEREPVPSLLEWPSDKLVPLSSLPSDEHGMPRAGHGNYGRTRQRMESFRRFRTAAVAAIAGAAVITLLVHANPTGFIHHLLPQKSPTPVGSVRGASTSTPTVAPVTSTFTPLPAPSSPTPGTATSQSMHAAAPATPASTEDICIGGSSFPTECAWSVTVTGEPTIALTISPTSPAAYTATVETAEGQVMGRYGSTADSIEIRIANPPGKLYVVVTPNTPPPHSFTISAS